MPDTSKTISRPDLWDGQGDMEFRNAITDLFAFASGMANLRRAFGELSGLGASGFGVLLTIWQINRLGQKAGINTIAEHMHVAAPHITAEVKKLEKSGLVAKKPDDRDARAVKLTLTANAEILLERIMPVMREVNDRLFHDITREELMTMSRLCRKIARATSDAQWAIHNRGPHARSA